MIDILLIPIIESIFSSENEDLKLKSLKLLKAQLVSNLEKKQAEDSENHDIKWPLLHIVNLVADNLLLTSISDQFLKNISMSI